jgi:putative endonuclease
VSLGSGWGGSSSSRRPPRSSRPRSAKQAPARTPAPESTHEKGRRGEDRAAALLRARGYHVVERNFRCRQGEIDVVARDGADTLVFVEVRTRADAEHGTALETVRSVKQRRIADAAAYYLSVRRPPFTRCRFDVLAITGEDVVLIKDAFRLP